MLYKINENLQSKKVTSSDAICGISDTITISGVMTQKKATLT